MTCKFRRAVWSDFETLLKDSTEGGKFDRKVFEESVDIRTLECDGVPVMAIGAYAYGEEDLRDILGVWAVVSKKIKGHVKEAVQFCKDLMFSRVNTKFLALIDERNPAFKRFVEFFGFQRTKIVEEDNGVVYHVYVKEN